MGIRQITQISIIYSTDPSISVLVSYSGHRKRLLVPSQPRNSRAIYDKVRCAGCYGNCPFLDWPSAGAESPLPTTAARFYFYSLRYSAILMRDVFETYPTWHFPPENNWSDGRELRLEDGGGGVFSWGTHALCLARRERQSLAGNSWVRKCVLNRLSDFHFVRN